jgi:hypothetical protein
VQVTPTQLGWAMGSSIRPGRTFDGDRSTMWDECKTLVSEEYQNHSFKMQFDCHLSLVDFGMGEILFSWSPM